MKTVYHELAAEMSMDECLDSFINMRKKIKKPMTENAIRLLKMRLKRLSGDETEQKAMLLQSEAMNWMGVFPITKQSERQSDDPLADVF